MSQNQQLIEKFYSSFQKCDWASMAECYHDDIHFSDPVFPDLHGLEAKAMWHMLCGRSKDLKVTFRDVQADETTGQAHWEATYSFGKRKGKSRSSSDATEKIARDKHFI